MACLRALGIDASTGGLDPLAGLIVFQSFQGLAVLVGGVVAGAGQTRGTILGGAAGLLSGLLVLTGVLSGVVDNLVQSYSAELLTPGTPIQRLIMYALPIQHVVLGAIGGFVGSLIWQPDAPVTLPNLGATPKRKPVRRDNRQASLRWSGPVAWVRVTIGIIVAVVGAIETPKIVDFILAASEGELTTVTQLENQVAYGEVFGLMILLGGCVAGATRTNGLKQGACVGFIVAIVMGGTLARAGSQFSPSLAFPVIAALLLAPVGGWFGSELLPPVFKRQRYKAKTWF
jgi:hypothetical protein